MDKFDLPTVMLFVAGASFMLGLVLTSFSNRVVRSLGLMTLLGSVTWALVGMLELGGPRIMLALESFHPW